MRPELVTLVQIEVRQTVAVETEIFEATRLPGSGRRKEGEFILSGIHQPQTEGRGREIHI